MPLCGGSHDERGRGLNIRACCFGVPFPSAGSLLADGELLAVYDWPTEAAKSESNSVSMRYGNRESDVIAPGMRTCGD